MEDIVPNQGKDIHDDECFWNIGVNPVLYRDGRDHMGFHADNDQGEELILSVLVSSPENATRRVRVREIRPKGKSAQKGDEELELFLDAGDAYSMDGM
jgi:alkylated DNA repair dioxygenase AlkB